MRKTAARHKNPLDSIFSGFSNNKAFTLVELLIVMAIIAILVGITIAGITYANLKARNNERISALDNIDRALIAFYDDNKYFPSSSSQSFDAVITGDLEPYMQGAWGAPSATVVYYRTNVRNIVYMICVCQEQFGGDRLYSCKGTGLGTLSGNWPQTNSEIDCEGVSDPVDCGSGPVTWDANNETWYHGTP